MVFLPFLLNGGASMLKRLEQFREIEKNIRIQKAVILGKKEILNKCYEEGLQGSVREFLESDYEKAKGTLTELLLEQIRERQELEEVLCESIHDERIRSIMILHYLQGQTLKDISKQFGLSYDYTKELNGNGRKVLSGMVTQ